MIILFFLFSNLFAYDIKVILNLVVFNIKIKLILTIFEYIIDYFNL